jgi:hypothetical protein
MKYTITFEACSDKEAQTLYMIFWAMVEARKAMQVPDCCQMTTRRRIWAMVEARKATQEQDVKTALEGDGENITYVDIDKARQVKK